MEQKTVILDSGLLGPSIASAVSQGGSFVLTVTGTSMRPTLTPGVDQVRLVSPEAVGVGDIVFFQRATGEYILHRVIRATDKGFLVNGDSQVWTETIRPSQIIATADAVCRGGHWRSLRAPLSRLYGRLWPATRSFRPALLRLRRLGRR